MTRAHLGCFALLTLAACSGSDDKETSDTGPVGGGCTDTELFMEDNNNYAFTADFQISTVEVTPETDFTVDWSGLSVDIRGRTVDPTSVESALFVEFQLTQAEILERIDANSFDQSDASYQYTWENNDDVSSMPANEFNAVGTPIDLTQLDDSSVDTWLLSLANDSTGRFDFLMNVFVKPTAGSTNTTVTLDNSTSTLNFDVDLQSNDKMCVPADEPSIILDWTQVTTDAYNRPLDLAYVNNLVIGHIADDDLEAVEGLFLRLYDEADQLYDLNVNGLDFAFLDEATSRADGTTPFPGFTPDGTWVVAVECTRDECTNPAPILLVVMDVQ